MSEPSSGKPTVSTAGKHLFIEVKSSRAIVLCTYLRQNGIVAEAPAPSCTGFDSIQLGKGMKLENVEALLDRWAA